MGEELPLAREEEEGQPVLLAITGSGESIYTSCNRNKRAKKSTSAKVSSRGKVKDTETKGESSSKTKGADARPKPKGYRRDNQDRKSDRGDEGKDKFARRGASELGITFPSSYCDENFLIPHYWVEVDKVTNGSLLQCILCRRHLWLPTWHTDANRLGELIRQYGKDEGYCRYLNRHRSAKILMAKLQDLRRLEAEIVDKMEFGRIADKILSDKNYDK